jgi:hypothetical protein
VNAGLVIALVGLVLVGAVLFVGIAAVAAAAWWWTRRAAVEAAGAARPAAPRAVHPDDHPTELFRRDSAFAFYDADEHDPTEQLRVEGGYLIDGRTDPQIRRPGRPASATPRPASTGGRPSAAAPRQGPTTLTGTGRVVAKKP